MNIMHALDQWCAYASAIVLLDQIHIRQAFHYRENIRAYLVSNQLPDDDDAALAAADDLWADEAARVIPFLTHGGWLDRQPADHYAHVYYEEHA